MTLMLIVISGVFGRVIIYGANRALASAQLHPCRKKF